MVEKRRFGISNLVLLQLFGVITAEPFCCDTTKGALYTLARHTAGVLAFLRFVQKVLRSIAQVLSAGLL